MPIREAYNIYAHGPKFLAPSLFVTQWGGKCRLKGAPFKKFLWVPPFNPVLRAIKRPLIDLNRANALNAATTFVQLSFTQTLLGNFFCGIKGPKPTFCVKAIKKFLPV